MSVEDVGTFTSDAAMKRKKAAEKKRKEVLTFKEREKRKRDRGQSSRGKSFVEGMRGMVCSPRKQFVDSPRLPEEKRLLRQAGM